MNICYLTESTIPAYYADSVQSMAMCAGLAEAGHRVTMIVPDRPLPQPVTLSAHAYHGLPESFVIRKIPWVLVAGRAYVYGPMAAWAARKLQPDLVYSRVIMEAIFSAELGLPTVLEVHSPVAGRVVRPLFKRLLRKRNLLRLIPISDALAAFYQETYSVASDRIVVARDAASLPPAGVAPWSPWPGRPDALQIGYFGAIVRGRGVELLDELARRLPEADFHVIGGTAGQIAYWKESLPEGRLIFHGALPPHAIPRCLARCAVVVAPYQRKVLIESGVTETTAWMSPMKLFEYMASGRAIVCSDLPALREFIEPEAHALMCPPDDVASWEAALRRLADDPALRARLGEAARREVEEKYTWKIRAEKALAGLTGPAR